MKTCLKQVAGENKAQRLIIRLAPADMKEVKVAAAGRGVPMAEFIREAVAEALSSSQQRMAA